MITTLSKALSTMDFIGCERGAKIPMRTRDGRAYADQAVWRGPARTTRAHDAVFMPTWSSDARQNETAAWPSSWAGTCRSRLLEWVGAGSYHPAYARVINLQHPVSTSDKLCPRSHLAYVNDRHIHDEGATIHDAFHDGLDGIPASIHRRDRLSPTRADFSRSAPA